MKTLSPRAWMVGAVAVAAALIVAGCDHKQVTPIGNITDNPGHFDGRDVEIAGHIDRVHDVPAGGIVDISAYQVDDGTGRIWVISRAGAPDRDRDVWLKGRVRAAGSFGGEALGAVIEEHERRIR